MLLAIVVISVFVAMVGATGLAISGFRSGGKATEETTVASETETRRSLTPQRSRNGRSRGNGRAAVPLPLDATVTFGALDRDLVGLLPIKKKVQEIAALLLVDRARQRFGLEAPRPNLHMCFTGPPGTGKTT